METFRSRMRRFTSKFSSMIAEQEDLSEADIPSSSQGGETEILNDIVSTEAEYDGALRELAQDLLPLFQDSTIINADDILTLFGNVEDLYDLHHTRFGPELYHRLRRRENPALVTTQTLVSRFSQIFVDYNSSFDAYFTYIQNRPKSETLLRERSADIKAVLDQTAKPLGKFQELLKVPLRRLDVYLDALESLINYENDAKIIKVLRNACNVIGRQFRYGEALWALERLSTGSLSIKDQLLFRIDDLTVKKEYHLTGRPKMRCVFLFTKCIIIAKRVLLSKDALPIRKGGDYGELKLKGQIDLRQPDKCGISGLLKNEPVFKLFYQCNDYLADVYAFKSETIETRNLWMRDICEVLGIRTELQLRTGEFGTAFLKSPILEPRRMLRKVDKTEELKRERLIRHSWPRHIIEEVQEAKEAKEGKRRRRFNIESQMITADFLNAEKMLARRSLANFPDTKH